MSLKQKTVSGAKWSGISQVALQILQFLFGVLLARLLIPNDFGLVGMIMVFGGFVGVLAEMGIGSAIIQKEKISDSQLSSAFWLNVMIGFSMMMLMFFSAPLLANFFEEPRLIGLTRAISITFLLGSLNVVQLSLMAREFEFKNLAVIEIFTFLTSGVIAVAFAFYGFGVWSLVIRQIIAILVKTILAKFLCRWLPSFHFQYDELKELIPYSLNLTGAKTTTYWIRNSDNVLIGKFVGADQLGVYSRAYGLMLMPIRKIAGAICKVMLPALSKIQNDRPRIKRIYLRTLQVIAVLTFPISLGMMAVSDNFVLVLLGDNWLDVAPILQVLCVLGLTQSLGTTAGVIYQACGRTDLQFKWTIYASAITLLSFVIGLQWGALGVATSYVISSLVFLLYPGTRIVGSLIDMTFYEYLKNVAGVFGCALTMFWLVVWLGQILQNQMMAWKVLTVQVALGVVVYVVLIAIFRVNGFLEIRDLVASSLKRKSSSLPNAPTTSADAS